MALFSFDNSNTGGGGPFNIFRGQADSDGNPVYEEKKFDDYVVPPAGQYRLKLTGFAEPKEAAIPEIYQKDGGPKTKMETRLELEIMDGPGKGHMWICSYVTFSLGDRANAFNLYVATLCDGDKKNAPQQRDWDDMLQKEFMGYVTNPKIKDDGTPLRAALSWDTLSPIRENAAGYDPFKKSNAA